MRKDIGALKSDINPLKVLMEALFRRKFTKAYIGVLLQVIPQKENEVKLYPLQHDQDSNLEYFLQSCPLKEKMFSPLLELVIKRTRLCKHLQRIPVPGSSPLIPSCLKGLFIMVDQLAIWNHNLKSEGDSTDMILRDEMIFKMNPGVFVL